MSSVTSDFRQAGCRAGRGSYCMVILKEQLETFAMAAILVRVARSHELASSLFRHDFEL
jgi:hypothetical protein